MLFCVIFLTHLLLTDLIIIYLLFCSSHVLVYNHSCTSSYIINSWFCLCVSLFISISSITDFGQVLTLLFCPRPRTWILLFTIISTVVIVTIMGLLYIILFLLLATSIFIWFPCCCFYGLTSLKFDWRYYCIVGQLILWMYSK